MPSGVRKNKSKCGVAGWEIYDKRSGKHVGCAKNKKDAHIAASMRDKGHKGEPGMHR